MTQRILFILSIAALGACADAHTVDEIHEEPSLEAGKADGVDHANWTFFEKTNDDFRRCMYPICGGMYVGRINQAKVKCDGTWQKECYVAQYDFSAITADEEEAVHLSQLARAGQLVVRGDIKKGFFADFPDIAVLAVTEAWSSLTEGAPTGIFYRAHDLGLMCITSPCVSTELTRLNRNLNPVSRVAGVDMSSLALDDAQFSYAWDSMRKGGVMLAGKLGSVTGPGGKAQTIIASQIYTRYTSFVPDGVGQECGGRAGACPEGLFCQFRNEYCGAEDGQGQCEVPPTVCTREYAPVCGCDGMTYANDCERKAAGAGFGTPGECRVQTGCQLGGCGGEVCANADAEPPISACFVRPTDHCYKNHGVCEKQAGGCGWTMTPELEDCLANPGASNPAQEF